MFSGTRKSIAWQKEIYIIYSFDGKTFFSLSLSFYLFFSYLYRRICRLDGEMVDMGLVGEVPSNIFQ